MRYCLALVAVFACACLGAPAEAAAAATGVVLNEINCEGTDWIELANPTGAPVDVSGWLLTDDPLTSTRADHRYLFPSGTVVPAGDDLVVQKGTGGFAFGVSCGSDTIRLADAAGALVDEEAVPTLLDGNDTWGRYPNGTGSWTETTSTQGQPNQPSSATGGPPADLAGWLFDPGKVATIDLTLPQSSIDALNADPGEYQDATFTLRTATATYGPMSVGARLKGGIGSFRPLSGKAAFKLKFNHSVAGQRFVGLEKLTLNNMVQDRSMVHEVAAYAAFRAAGVPAPRTGYAYVHVNGSDYGVYLDVETPDHVFLGRWFDSTRHLYEGEYGADATPDRAGELQVDEGSTSERSDLDALVAAAAPDTPGYPARMAAVADLTEMRRMWAVERYIGHVDGYSGQTGAKLPNNYYLHSDSGGRFSQLPWGTDQTWSRRIAFDGPAQGVLYARCRSDAECAAAYREAVRDSAATIGGLDLDGLITATAGVLRPYQEADPRREASMRQIDDAVTAMRGFVRLRREDAAAWPAPPAAAAPGGSAVLTAPGPGPAFAPAPTRLRLRFGVPRLSAGYVLTRVVMPGPGRAGQRTTLRAAGRVHTVCTAGARRLAGAVVDLRCRLSPFARRLVRRYRTRLYVRTWFVPAAGPASAVTRWLVG
ncbi:MAG: hypothetical protein QOE65_2161 [Solirubrobacteraceae bacterium]|nr:hypothetical protein [Solirubrobacteraceae bacterium]